jgi:spoIIIJ-associated protein
MENEDKTETRQEFKGKNFEEVISLAEHILKLPRDKFNYEVVAAKTRLFGIKGKEIVIRAWPKDESEENIVADFLDRLTSHFPLELTYEIKKRNGITYIVFDGEDKSLLLRRDGTLLLAMQHILNKISPQKVQLDCEFFRKRKEKKLREFALQVAREVYDSRKDEILELMNPYERRIIHIAVNQVAGITSESIGDGFLKRVKIFPAGSQGK